MSRYIGNYLRVPSLEPQQVSAPGIWSLSEQLNYQRANVWPPARDPYYNQTVLHLSGDVAGTKETNPVTQPRTFLSDASTNNFLLIPNGDVSARPFSPYGGNNYSYYFDGSSYLRASPSSLSSPTFTIELWFYYIGANNATATLFDFSGGVGGYGMLAGHNSSGQLNFQAFATNSNAPVVGTITSSAAGLYNQWVHFAITFDASNYRMFVNGNLVATLTSSTQIATLGSMVVGARSDSAATQAWQGYISNLRYITGTALYTSNFTPSTTPLTIATSGTTRLLTCQSNRFIDNSTSPYTLAITGSPRVTDNSPFVSYDTTSGSGYFDGTTDYLTAPASNIVDFASGQAFTFECWFHPTTSAVMAITQGGGNTFSIDITPGSSGNINYGKAGVLNIISGSASMPVGTWNHLAIARNTGNQSRMWVNGVSIGSSNSDTYSFNNAIQYIGSNANPGSYFVGYLSNVRVVKGTALYDPTLSSNIIVPTVPLTPVTNTSLLTLQTRAPANNQGILDTSPNNFVVTRTGNVAQGSFSPFSASGWSNYFNGSNQLTLDQLSAASSLSLAPEAGQFCLEFWIYPIAAWTGDRPVFVAAATGGLWVGYTASAFVLRAYAVTNHLTYATPPALNTWTHVAICRNSGNTTSMYFNGSRVATGNITQNFVQASVYIGSDGAYGASGAALMVAANLSNVRFVKGSSVYDPTLATLTNMTTGITGAPTSPLTAISGTQLLTCQANRFIDQTGKTITVNGSPSVQPFSPFAPTQAYVATQLGGSAYFDSSGDSLTVASAPALNMTGDFCMEAWAYPTTAGISFAWKYTAGVVSTSEYFWAIDGTNQLSVALDGGGGEDYFRTAANTITLNAWNHCVITRVGTAIRQFINGVLQSYNTTSRTLNTTSTNFSTSANSGYISGLRIIRGSIPDMYQTTATTTGTAVFIPPTTPVISVPGTSLLLNFTGAGIVDSTGRNNLETMGNSSVQTKVLKYGNVATYIPNTASTGSNKLVAPNFGGNFSFGTGDLTIEAWFYLITLPSGLTTPNNEAIFSCGSNGPILAISGNAPNTNKIVFANYGGTLTIYSTNTVSAGVWYHVAVSRASGNTRLYINGALEGSSTTVEAMNASNTITIGQDPVGNNQAFNGYIDSLRITKGYARYVNGTASNASQMVFNGTNILAIPTLTFPLA